jgi:FMN phosphatase YigB (HAD superfamily)
MLNGISAVFFDLGDTITDLGEGRGDYERRVLARAERVYAVLSGARIALPEQPVFCRALAEGTELRYQASVVEQSGLTIAEALRSLYQEMGLHVQDNLLAESAEAYCGGSVAPAPLRQGAQDVLAWLCDQNLRLGVISNTIQPGYYLDKNLERRGILHFFAARIYSSDAGMAKPHPGIFRAALAALDVSPERAVHVGDRLIADVSGAQGAGMSAVLIRVAGRVEEDPGIIPDASIDELTELPRVLEKMAMDRGRPGR